jgi:hypothetical protein
MNSFATGTIAITLGLAALLAIGCSAAEGQDASSDTNVANVEQAITASFVFTCGVGDYYPLGNNRYHAGATFCYRRNGSKRWGPWFENYCYGDLSNCNGEIVCQSSCP